MPVERSASGSPASNPRLIHKSNRARQRQKRRDLPDSPGRRAGTRGLYGERPGIAGIALPGYQRTLEIVGANHGEHAGIELKKENLLGLAAQDLRRLKHLVSGHVGLKERRHDRRMQYRFGAYRRAAKFPFGDFEPEIHRRIHDHGSFPGTADEPEEKLVIRTGNVQAGFEGAALEKGIGGQNTQSNPFGRLAGEADGGMAEARGNTAELLGQRFDCSQLLRHLTAQVLTSKLCCSAARSLTNFRRKRSASSFS